MVQSNDWRCTRCSKKLGTFENGRLHIRFSDGHEYFVHAPAIATCRGCHTLNELQAVAVSTLRAARSV